MSLFILDRKAIGADLKRARRFLGLTIKQVSGRSGVAASHIWNLENGVKEMSLEKYFALCLAVAVSPADALQDNFIVDRAALESSLRKQAGPDLERTSKGAADSFILYEAACCIALATLLIIPGENRIPGGSFAFPTRSLAEKFDAVQMAITTDFSLSRRAEYLQRLESGPEAVLRELGFLSDKLFEDWMDYLTADATARVKAGSPVAGSLVAWNGRPARLLDYYMRGEDSEDFAPSNPERSRLLLNANAGLMLFGTEMAILKDKNKSLHGITPQGKHEGVKAQFDSLRKRLKKATAAPGMKAALARFMCVEPPRVSEWLREKKGKIPGGEATLKLLRWVEQREAK